MLRKSIWTVDNTKRTSSSGLRVFPLANPCPVQGLTMSIGALPWDGPLTRNKRSSLTMSYDPTKCRLHKRGSYPSILTSRPNELDWSFTSGRRRLYLGRQIRQNVSLSALADDKDRVCSLTVTWLHQRVRESRSARLCRHMRSVRMLPWRTHRRMWTLRRTRNPYNTGFLGRATVQNT